MLNLIFIIFLLAVIILFVLLVDLVTTMKLSYQEEWHSLDRPSPWLVSMNMSLLVHILTGRFVATAPDKLLPKYKTLRFILFVNIFCLVIYAIFIFK